MKSTNHNSKLAYNLFCSIAIVFILYILKPVLVPLIFSVILSIILYPVVVFLEKRWHYNRVMSTVTALVLLLIVVIGLFTFIGFQIKDVIDKTDVYFVRLSELFQGILQYCETSFGIDKKQLLQDRSLKIENVVKNNFSRIGELLTESGSLLGDLFLIPIYVFFLLLYRKFFVEFIHKAFPKKDNAYLNIILNKIYTTQQNYLIGLTTVMGIVGLLNSAGLLLLGIENAVFYGFLGALLLLIPYIGVIIGSLIPAFVALATKDSAWYSVGVIGVFTFVQLLEGNFITPKITGSKVNLNAFVSILALVLFSLLWGISGMILALPATATLKIIFDQIPSLKPYGFVLGEPEEEFLKSKSFARLLVWRSIRKNK